MGLVLDSGVLIAAERAARPVSQLLTALAQEFGETEIVLSSISVVELEHGLHRASTTELAQKAGIISTRFSRRFRLSRLPGRWLRPRPRLTPKRERQGSSSPLPTC